MNKPLTSFKRHPHRGVNIFTIIETGKLAFSFSDHVPSLKDFRFNSLKQVISEIDYLLGISQKFKLAPEVRIETAKTENSSTKKGSRKAEA